MSPETGAPLRPPRLIGLPYDGSSSFLRGAARAPPAIREALHSLAGNSWAEDLRDVLAPGALTDAGDLPLSTSAAAARDAIANGIASVVSGGARPIALGGDHSVTYPILRGMTRTVAPPTILHLDAHPDLYEEYGEDRFSHACPFARILEEGMASRLVQVGIRAMTGHQRDQAARFGVEVIDMRSWAAGRRPRVSGEIYLSIDLDVLDPAHAPGVSHREPGGLTVREVLGIIQTLPGALVGADVVELNPLRDESGMSTAVAAKLVREVAGRMLAEG